MTFYSLKYIYYNTENIFYYKLKFWYYYRLFFKKYLDGSPYHLEKIQLNAIAPSLVK